MSFRKRGPGIRAILSAGVVLAIVLSGGAYSASSDEIVYSDVKEQTRQFMEWEKTIRLTPQQEARKKEALSAIPAPCCSDNSAYTCCCACNVSRTIWGLTNHLITKQDASPEQIRAKVTEWVGFINPQGYKSGDTCYTAGCPRAFKHDGCGGMSASHVVY